MKKYSAKVIELDKGVESEIKLQLINEITLVCFGYGYGSNFDSKIKEGSQCLFSFSPQFFNDASINEASKEQVESITQIGNSLGYIVVGRFSNKHLVACNVFFECDEFTDFSYLEEKIVVCSIDRLDLDEITQELYE